MKRTLAGERDIEYKWVRDKLPMASSNARLLDLGPEGSLKTTKIALQRGWWVTACGLEPINRPDEPGRFKYIKGDFNQVPWATDQVFDWVLNISTIEHFGLAGRYGVSKAESHYDLIAMRELKFRARNMILTIPVGVDTVWPPFHRVYGEQRLPNLLAGWNIHVEQYWAKVNECNDYSEVSRSVALAQHSTIDPFYYCIGTFVLRNPALPAKKIASESVVLNISTEEGWEEVKNLLLAQHPVTLKIVDCTRDGLIAGLYGIMGFIPNTNLLKPVNLANSQRRLLGLKEYVGNQIEVRVQEVEPQHNRLILSEI